MVLIPGLHAVQSLPVAMAAALQERCRSRSMANNATWWPRAISEGTANTLVCRCGRTDVRALECD